MYSQRKWKKWILRLDFGTWLWKKIHALKRERLVNGVVGFHIYWIRNCAHKKIHTSEEYFYPKCDFICITNTTDYIRLLLQDVMWWWKISAKKLRLCAHMQKYNKFSYNVSVKCCWAWLNESWRKICASWLRRCFVSPQKYWHFCLGVISLELIS